MAFCNNNSISITKFNFLTKNFTQEIFEHGCGLIKAISDVTEDNLLYVSIAIFRYQRHLFIDNIM